MDNKNQEQEFYFEEITETDNGEADNFTRAANFLPFVQSLEYGLWQNAAGKRTRMFTAKNIAGKVIAKFQIIKYNLPLKKSFLYIPHGPITTEKKVSEGFLRAFCKKINGIGKEEGVVFLRFDFFPPNFAIAGQLKKLFRKAPMLSYQRSVFQPKMEWVLNLAQEKSEILKNMHQKTRYNIGLAQKKGVEIKIVDKNFLAHFEKFYELMDDTARRNKFGLHDKEYYRNIFKICEERKNAFLAIARCDEKIIVINFVFCFGGVANFVFGGSADEYKNLMPSYLAHWEGIKEAKKRDLKFYDFGGYAEDDKIYKGWEHLSVFKRKFGGTMFEYGDSYDAIFQPVWYYLYMVKKMLSNLINNFYH